MTVRSSRKDDILQALASRLQNAPGGRITTAALAADVGVSEAALYRHFPSKTRMFEGLIDFVEEALLGRINSLAKEPGDAIGQCGNIVTLLVTFAERNPGITRILNGDALTGETERLHERVEQLFERIEAQLRQLLREAEIRDGLKLAVPPSAAANLLLAAAEGKISQFVRSRFKALPSQLWREQWPLLATALRKS